MWITIVAMVAAGAAGYVHGIRRGRCCPWDGSRRMCLFHDQADVEAWTATTQWIRAQAQDGDVPPRAS